MLYDPKWEVQAKPDVFSLESLIAWLEKMPARQEYSYVDADNCLIGQYLRAHGQRKINLTPEDLNNRGWYYIASGYPNLYSTVEPEPRTFGAALKRARAAL